MGRLNRGPNGPFSGKAGSFIGSSWRGIYYIKGLQKKITKARSPLQIEQQQRFALAVKFLRYVKPIVDMGFSHVNPRGATGYNMAISHMLQHSIKGKHPDLEIHYPSVVFALGKLTLPENLKMEVNGLKLKLSWSTETDNYKSFKDDQVMILIYRPKSFDYQFSDQEITRIQAETELELDSWHKDVTVHVYLYLVEKRGKRWSDSLYLGSVDVER